ncbi:unnamed protein product [Onchocerca ochengi]|uniref:Protein Wnt n=1 Tax=Onchocerca ochengi TaxID=42157 RepID=A0A182EGK5_ONCOC|nr:unnamed protein product [Onchocerca ochengi]
MPRKRSNLGHHIRAAEGMHRLIANQTEEKRASVNERTKQRMAQMRAERRQPDFRMHGCEHVDLALNSEYNPADYYSLSPHVLISTMA